MIGVYSDISINSRFLNSLSNFTSLSISNSRSTQYNRCGLDACQFMGISYSVPLLERCYLSQGMHWITVEINHRQGSWEIPWCKCSYFWSTWLVNCWIQFICSFIFQINLAYSFKYTLCFLTRYFPCPDNMMPFFLHH